MQTIKSERATQIPEAKIAARIPRDRLYRMSKDFFDTIDRLALGHRGRRLLHGLIHATCKKNDDWHSRHVLPLGECRVACQVLRQRLDMKGSDNRSLAAGLEELRRSGIFNVLTFCNERQWLAWQMTDVAYACLFTDPQYGYGYFDIQDVKVLRTVMDFRLHDRFGVIRAQKRPETAFIIDAPGPNWETQRRSFVRALQRTSGRCATPVRGSISRADVSRTGVHSRARSRNVNGRSSRSGSTRVCRVGVRRKVSISMRTSTLYPARKACSRGRVSTGSGTAASHGSAFRGCNRT